MVYDDLVLCLKYINVSGILIDRFKTDATNNAVSVIKYPWSNHNIFVKISRHNVYNEVYLTVNNSEHEKEARLKIKQLDLKAKAD